jgi:hypothetical protein
MDCREKPEARGTCDAGLATESPTRENGFAPGRGTPKINSRFKIIQYSRFNIQDYCCQGKNCFTKIP